MTRIARHALIAFAAPLAALACVPPGRASGPRPFSRAPTACASGAGTDTTLYDTTQVSELPTPRTVARLTYPSAAGRRGIQGRVVVAAIVSSDGTIDSSSVTVIHSVHPLLDAEAQRFVWGSTLWPACRDGEPVRVRIAVPVVFDARRRAMVTPQQGFLIGLMAGLGGLVAALLFR